MDKINFAILGAGGIGAVMAKTIAGMPAVTPYAVAARDFTRARTFADEHGIHKAFASYQEMLEDPAVQLVYVATPHSHHYEHAKLCLEHGKHVLCEKAFTTTAAEAEELIALARARKLLITEAIWPRYMPFSRTINELLFEQRVIGDVYSLTASLCYNLKHIERVIRPELAGGALLDLSVYPLNFAFMIFGSETVHIASSCSKLDTGVDAQNTIILTFASGQTATLYATMLSVTDRRGIIYGDKGYMVIENINNPESATIYNNDWKLLSTYDRPQQITGYEYEVEACMRALTAGAVECPEMPHAETIRIMQLFDSLRAEWGISFAPQDQH